MDAPGFTFDWISFSLVSSARSGPEIHLEQGHLEPRHVVGVGLDDGAEHSRSIATLKPSNIVFIIAIICGFAMSGPPASGCPTWGAPPGLSGNVIVSVDTPAARVA